MGPAHTPGPNPPTVRLGRPTGAKPRQRHFGGGIGTPQLTRNSPIGQAQWALAFGPFGLAASPPTRAPAERPRATRALSEHYHSSPPSKAMLGEPLLKQPRAQWARGCLSGAAAVAN